MSSQFVTNDPQENISVLQAIEEVLRPAVSVDLAVSYVKTLGWQQLLGVLRRIGVRPENVRLVVTDQFGITQPDALEQALQAGATIRNYIGRGVYHPKVYLALNANHDPISAIVGSANLSDSALTDGIEAAVSIYDRVVLRDLKKWLDKLFNDEENTQEIDSTLLKELRARWKRLASQRVRAELGVGRRRRHRARSAPTIASESVEDLFSTIALPIAVLGIDQAGNNVRNLSRLLEVLRRFPLPNDKERSELHLLGLMERGSEVLTELGQRARNCRTEKQLAKTWCKWIFKASDAELLSVNDRLPSFKHAATWFWRLSGEVREFFFQNLPATRDKRVLQAIEILCSEGPVVETLMVNDFSTLAGLLMAGSSLPLLLREPVRAYYENKAPEVGKIQIEG